MDGSGEFFAEFAAALAPQVASSVVSYPALEHGYPELVAVARQALPERPFILVGESFSGPVAISIAASSPPGLRGVVLVCSFARSPVPRFLRWLPGTPPVWRVPDWLAARMLLGRFSTPAYARLLGSSLRRVPPPVWRARMRAVLSVDVTAELRKVAVPILYLRASWDRVVPRAATDWVLSNAKDATVVDLDGPHFLLQARAAEAAEHVKSFMRRVGVSASLSA
jgi:pimeloyl-[acyl-carrier protein] methyl ester esterase